MMGPGWGMVPAAAMGSAGMRWPVPYMAVMPGGHMMAGHHPQAGAATAMMVAAPGGQAGQAGGVPTPPSPSSPGAATGCCCTRCTRCLFDFGLWFAFALRLSIARRHACMQSHCRLQVCTALCRMRHT